MLANNTAYAENSSTLVPPTDPKQSITYWKKYILDDELDLVQQSQQIFSVLLRAWDQSRIEPGLYVVESDAGAWAASLADGNILLSKQAIETCYSFGGQRGEHLLAFVLAHELAHQRSDDLWHQRFFRMLESQSAESQKTMIAGLDLNSELITQLEQKEAQADHDGLVLMSSVGFDAHQVVNDKDFFTLWVENIWQQNCTDNKIHSSHYDACKQAQARALRTQTQLETVATQSMLYDLGVEKFVAGDYLQAREYFTIYGRDYPGRAIITAIGLSYFAQAQDIQKQLIELKASLSDNTGSQPQLDFYYPMILDAQVSDTATKLSAGSKRADTKSMITKLQKQKTSLIDQSISQFEKAIRLTPDYRETYLLLASSHLLANNSYRVRGVLQGQYIKKFGNDNAVDMLLALTMAIEGKTDQAIKELERLSLTSTINKNSSVLAENILRYSVTYNLAELYDSVDRSDDAKKSWMKLAQLSQKNGDALLFRLAVSHLEPNNHKILRQNLPQAPTIEGNRLGDSMSLAKTANKSRAELWIDGERYQILIDKNSRYITQDDGTLISARQTNSETKAITGNNKLHIGDSADRPFKTLGIPDRRLNLTSGEYLAYDDYGLAVRISNDQVRGWFLYETD
jgi:tetratricopeptide (TPR) repeat protein